MENLRPSDIIRKVKTLSIMLRVFFLLKEKCVSIKKEKCDFWRKMSMKRNRNSLLVMISFNHKINNSR